eukprot:SAG31_NODE_5200_length_2681_cov_4.109218_3_plen_74_part_00
MPHARPCCPGHGPGALPSLRSSIDVLFCFLVRTCIRRCSNQVVLEWMEELREDADEEEDAKAVLENCGNIITQ